MKELELWDYPEQQIIKSGKYTVSQLIRFHPKKFAAALEEHKWVLSEEAAKEWRNKQKGTLISKSYKPQVKYNRHF